MSLPYAGLIERYRDYLPVSPQMKRVTLLEGNTPLLAVPRLESALNVPPHSLYLKLEGMNPTASFKDRGMTMAVSKALEAGSKAVISASTGNTSASAAAYAARAGLRCVVLVPEGNIALGKLCQSLMYGADVLSVDGNFDVALKLVREVSEKVPITMVNSLNPHRLIGQKTGAFEIVDALGKPPDYQFMPVGNAGNITAYWMGYKEYFDRKVISSKPKMMGFQAEGAAPIVRGAPVTNPQTVATAIRIGNPASWTKAEAARDESGGVIDAVSDQEILDAYRLMAREEGVFCEPASAVGVAGFKKYLKSGKMALQPGQTAVCIVTGHGLKDPDRAIAVMPRPTPVKPTIQSIIERIKI